jgi:hypothetical protein
MATEMQDTFRRPMRESRPIMLEAACAKMVLLCKLSQDEYYGVEDVSDCLPAIDRLRTLINGHVEGDTRSRILLQLNEIDDKITTLCGGMMPLEVHETLSRLTNSVPSILLDSPDFFEPIFSPEGDLMQRSGSKPSANLSE